MHVAFLRLSALGDVVMASSVVKHLARHNPEVTIDWITDRGFSELWNLPENVKVVGVDKVRSLQGFWKLKRMFSHLSYDFVFVAQASSSAHLAAMQLKGKKIGFDSIRGKEGHRFFVDETVPFLKNHLMEGYLSIARMLKQENLSRLDMDTLRLDALPWVETNLPPRYLVFCPVSRQREKNYPFERYIDIFERFEEVPIVVCGGNSAFDRRFENMYAKVKNVIFLAGKTDLMQLFAIIKRAACVVAPDSGPIHIANNLGVPVISLFGATSSHASGPYLQQHYAIDVYEESRRRYGLSSDRFHRIRKKGVMNPIHPNRIIESLSQLIS
ncbi:MAG: hypothetical protein A3F09_03930 [Chlamydiae bacterium RIFCSPHIGHO2_12_FULL_49_11]|nr:MAG: hypothetical protein A3F09_03930 [Chlamydiae bacterium RIFCSPHIGHO2_12_FULL_49_11]